MINHYLVGDHVFAIEAEEQLFDLLPNYTPFLTDQIGESHVFIIHVHQHAMPENQA